MLDPSIKTFCPLFDVTKVTDTGSHTLLCSLHVCLYIRRDFFSIVSYCFFWTQFMATSASYAIFHVDECLVILQHDSSRGTFRYTVATSGTNLRVYPRHSFILLSNHCAWLLTSFFCFKFSFRGRTFMIHFFLLSLHKLKEGNKKSPSH